MTLTRLSGYMFLVAFSQFACGESHFVVKSNDSPQEIVKPAVQIHSDRLQKLLDSPSISPYAIENYIKESAESDEEYVDFKPVWERLHIPKNTNETLSEEDRESYDGFKPSYSRWQVELINTRDAAEGFNQIVVKIMIYGGAIRRFLIFKPEIMSAQNIQWKFCGHIDEWFPKINPDIQQFHRVYSDENGSWLILRNGGGYGTGCAQEQEIWYRIDTEPPQEVLDYAIEGGRVNGCVCDVEYKSKAKTLTDKDGTLNREITYQVSFGAAYKPDFHWLFTKTCKAIFRWDGDEGKFIFDSRNSTLSEAEINSEFGGIVDEEFFKYNFDRLLQFAKTANSEQRAWLEEVLDNLKDESQKMKLRNALGH